MVKSHHHTEHSYEIDEDRKTYCPITGDQVDSEVAEREGHVRESNGEKLYFCCDDCAKLFDKKRNHSVVG